MKRLLLTILFCIYYFFIPFIFVNCGQGEDLPYIKKTKKDDFSNCSEFSILTKACKDEIDKREKERQDAQNAAGAGAAALMMADQNDEEEGVVDDEGTDDQEDGADADSEDF